MGAAPCRARLPARRQRRDRRECRSAPQHDRECPDRSDRDHAHLRGLHGDLWWQQSLFAGAPRADLRAGECAAHCGRRLEKARRAEGDLRNGAQALGHGEESRQVQGTVLPTLGQPERRQCDGAHHQRAARSHRRGGGRRRRQVDVVSNRGRAESQRQQAHRARRMTMPAPIAPDGGAATAPTLALAQFAASLTGQALPSDIKVKLGELLLDYVRVASIGAGMSWSAWADSYMADLGGQGRAAVLFRPHRRDAVRAAFLNATYAGSIDADDTHVGSMLHPGSIVFSAALALADEIDADGQAFVAAVAAGYEAMIRIALAIQPSHFQRGFQSTATCGGFGAAVAAARLAFHGTAAADHKIASTIGLVASFSGGLTQFYQSGSTVKRIHAARAAENGVAAALLVRQGFTGPQDIIEGANGFARAYADAADLGIITKGLGSDYLLREVTVKGHACSARVQAAVEGILDLCKANRIQPDDVADLFVGIPAVILGRLTIPKPIDVQAAQMSLPHSAALAVAMASAAEDGFALS